MAELPCTLALDQRIVDRRRSTERRLHFDSPTHTRVNSDSCINDGYCLRHFSVDTARSTYFSPFPSRTLSRSTRMMTDSGQLWSSISLPGYHVDFFTFAEHVSFEHSTGSPWPVVYSGREGNINKQTYKTQKFQVHTRSSIRQSASPLLTVFGRSAASARPGAVTATFRSNRKYRYRPHTQSDVGNCWPCQQAESKLHHPSWLRSCTCTGLPCHPQVGQVRAFCESVPRKNVASSYFWSSKGHTSITVRQKNQERITLPSTTSDRKEPESEAKMFENQLAWPDGVKKEAHITSLAIPRKYRYVSGCFFRTLFSTTFRSRISVKPTGIN